MDDRETRLYLHGLLSSIFPNLGLYYQLSGNISVERPCIVYQKKALEPSFANNQAYSIGTRYQIMFLSDLPGYEDVRRIYELSTSGISVVHNDDYISNNVVHNVFTVSVGTL